VVQSKEGNSENYALIDSLVYDDDDDADGGGGGGEE
jgi:hypothetical protein